MGREIDERAAGRGTSCGRRGCLTCSARCSSSVLRFSLPGPHSSNIRRIRGILTKNGFMVHSHINLADLARQRLGIDASQLDILYVSCELLHLQSLFTVAEPSSFAPFVAILRPSGDATDVCVTALSSQRDDSQSTLTTQLRLQARQRLAAALELLLNAEGADPTAVVLERPIPARFHRG